MNVQALCYTKCNNRHDGNLLKNMSQCLVFKRFAFGNVSEKNAFLTFAVLWAIIKCSAHETGIYFKLLCQYFCLKAGLIPCADFVEAFYHCFLFEFDLASFPPDFVFCRMACMKAFWLGWGGIKLLCEFQSPENVKKSNTWWRHQGSECNQAVLVLWPWSFLE